ncbi:MetS family NSS transporter small subunit [Ferrimonas pelagia]
MDASAIVMMIFGFACTWGGALFCIRIAIRASRR